MVDKYSFVLPMQSPLGKSLQIIHLIEHTGLNVQQEQHLKEISLAAV